ncbi:hypothetical protein ABK040_001226 [Willaertia magna]
MLFKEQLGIIEQYQDNSTSPLFKKTFKSTTPNLDQLKSIKISELQFAKTNSGVSSNAGIVIEDKTLLYFGGVSPQKDMKLRSFSHRGELVLYDTQGGSSIIPKPSGDLPNAVLLD